jgi:beta-glucosidase-like glycosyl hydrolase
MAFRHVLINFFLQQLPGNKFSSRYLFISFIFAKRESFHLDGFVVGDCGAVSTIMNAQNYTSTIPDTVAAALHAGTDLDCGHFYLNYTQQALDNGTIVEDDIDQALHHTFNVLVRLGWFDPPEQQPYRHLNKDNVNTTDAQQLALKSAQESIVLLKNVNKALPLNIDQLKNKTIALIGPTANATGLMQGNYHGNAPFLISPVAAFTSLTASTIETKTFHFDVYSHPQINRSTWNFLTDVM